MDSSNLEESCAMKKIESKSREMSTEAIISIPAKKGSKASITCITVFDIVTSKSMIDMLLVKDTEFVTNSGNDTVWKTSEFSKQKTIPR